MTYIKILMICCCNNVRDVLRTYPVLGYDLLKLQPELSTVLPNGDTVSVLNRNRKCITIKGIVKIRSTACL